MWVSTCSIPILRKNFLQKLSTDHDFAKNGLQVEFGLNSTGCANIHVSEIVVPCYSLSYLLKNGSVDG